jgi:hypothetical protein
MMDGFTGTNVPIPPQPLSEEEVKAYLDWAGIALCQRRDTLIESLVITAGKIERIEDDEVLGPISENMKMASALVRTAKDRHGDHKRPFRVAGEAVDLWFRRFAEPLAEAVQPIQLMMNAYAKRKYEEENARREEIRIKAEAEAKRLNEIAAKELETGRAARKALDDAADAAKAADKAKRQAEMRPSAMTQSRGVYGTTASARVTWKWRVTDISLIPPELMMVNTEAVKERGRPRDASGKPIAVIPGIEWYSDVAMGVR